MGVAQNPRFPLTEPHRERSKERAASEHPPAAAERVGPPVRPFRRRLERALTLLYVSQPLRWQTFMDEAQVLIDAVGEYDSGFAETVQPVDG